MSPIPPFVRGTRVAARQGSRLHGLARLRDTGPADEAHHLLATGLGEIDDGRLILFTPDLVEPFLRAQGLVADDDVVFALCRTPFGGLGVGTRAGRTCR